MAVVESSAEQTSPSAASAPYRAASPADAGEREMRDLEELLSKLNPMAEEFVPPSLSSGGGGGGGGGGGSAAAAYGFYPNGGYAVASPAPGGIVGFHGGDGPGGGRRKGGGYGHGGKRRMNSRTSNAQREEVIRRTVYVSDIDHQISCWIEGCY